jgi:TFIIF-interacting CTD phosphatase-like protein
MHFVLKRKDGTDTGLMKTAAEPAPAGILYITKAVDDMYRKLSSAPRFGNSQAANETRAYAVTKDGENLHELKYSSSSSGRSAGDSVKECSSKFNQACVLFAIDDQIVYRGGVQQKSTVAKPN